MANITLHTDSPVTATCVPNVFIDRYMVQASGEYVKIYLYLLRCITGNKSELSISKMADKFEHTEKDIKRALKYWEKMNLLHLEYDEKDELSSINFLDSPTPQPFTHNIAKPKKECQTSSEISDKKSAARREYSANEIDHFRSNEEVRTLFFVAEKYMCHPLTTTDVQTILYWYDTLKFSSELIEYLIEFCVEKGHSATRYMDKVALSWAEMNIKTAEQAKQTSNVHNQAYYAVIKSLGINNRNLVPYEMDFIEKWMKEYGFSLDIITEACKRTIQAIHQPSFEYTDTILHSWKDHKIHHLEDIATLDAAYKNKKMKKHPAAPKSNGNKFNNFSQRNYNYDQLERQLLNRSIQ
ncbi:MAG: DnaD domain protein [Lachnospiraceae bacterium]|nr:DnaD domain protein [Lachnospiraceae bacterium]